MEEEQILSTEDLTPQESGGNGKEAQGLNKFLAGLVIVLLLILVGGGAYYFGTKEGKNTSESPTPTQSLKQETLGQELINELPTSTPTPVATVTAKLKPKSTPTPTPTPKIITKTITSTADLDGFESDNGRDAGVDIRAGRNMYLVSRGFVSFDISVIPVTATVTEATLRLYQTKTVGNPYTVGGNLMVDYLNYGTTLDNSDYALAAITSNLALLTANSTVEWKDANVTDAVKKDLQEGRSHSQYRIHFETEVKGGDVTGDFSYFESADNSESSGNIPQLVIKYY